MRGMKTHYIINVYILTDKNGDWWEWLRKDGSTRMWQGSTATPNPTKEFKTAEQAQRHAVKQGFARFRILKQDPPAEGSITWPQFVVFDSQSDIVFGGKFYTETDKGHLTADYVERDGKYYIPNPETQAERVA